MTGWNGIQNNKIIQDAVQQQCMFLNNKNRIEICIHQKRNIKLSHVHI